MVPMAKTAKLVLLAPMALLVPMVAVEAVMEVIVLLEAVMQVELEETVDKAVVAQLEELVVQRLIIKIIQEQSELLPQVAMAVAVVAAALVEMNVQPVTQE
jgi:hypothetical protein